MSLLNTVLKPAVAFSIIALSCSLQARDAINSFSQVEIDSSQEILASSYSRDGQGEIEITQDEDGVGIFVSFPIGYELNTPRELENLPYALQVSGLYQQITGLELPEKAYQALIDFEIQKLRNIRSTKNLFNEIDALTNGSAEPTTPRNGCTDKKNGESFFQYDCKVYGAISKVEKADDVCLLTAAYKGDHVAQVSYYSQVQSKWKIQSSKTVYKGYWAAYEKVTSVKRWRKGAIVGASASDYSRFAFEGDSNRSPRYDLLNHVESNCYIYA